jgi:hypothetical protein
VRERNDYEKMLMRRRNYYENEGTTFRRNGCDDETRKNEHVLLEEHCASDKFSLLTLLQVQLNVARDLHLLCTSPATWTSPAT